MLSVFCAVSVCGLGEGGWRGILVVGLGFFFYDLSYPILLPQITELAKCCLLWRLAPGFTNSSRALHVECCGYISLGLAQTHLKHQ